MFTVDIATAGRLQLNAEGLVSLLPDLRINEDGDSEVLGHIDRLYRLDVPDGMEADLESLWNAWEDYKREPIDQGLELRHFDRLRIGRV